MSDWPFPERRRTITVWSYCRLAAILTNLSTHLGEQP
jgi:hypothetical protein